MFALKRVKSNSLGTCVNMSRNYGGRVRSNSSRAWIVRIPFPTDSTIEIKQTKTVQLKSEHPIKDTKGRANVGSLDSNSSRSNKISNNWRHTNSFGIPFAASGGHKDLLTTSPPRKVLKVSLQLYKDWPYSDSFGRMGVHAGTYLAQAEKSSSTKNGNNHSLEPGAEGFAELADTESTKKEIPRQMDCGGKTANDNTDSKPTNPLEESSKDATFLCKGLCHDREKTKKSADSEVAGKTTDGNGDEGFEGEDCDWGRGSYPYTRMF